MTPGGSREPKSRRTWDEGRPGGYDPELNLADMELDGIDVAVEFPSAGLHTPLAPDAGLASALCRAVNNWANDYCRPALLRLYAVGILPLHDSATAIAEVERLAAFPCFKGLLVRPNPAPPHGRVLHDPELEALRAAVEDAGLPLAIHEGTNAARGVTVGIDRFPTFMEKHAISHTMEQMLAVMSFTTGGILARFPRLRVAFLESGCGWLPYWLEGLDGHFEQLRWEKSELHLRPSEYFQRQGFLTCEPGEVALPLVVRHIGRTS
jgi:predicted TIM-barrel fold metal-dependent hydrolase